MKNRKLLVAIAQAKIEPWENIWKFGQFPTWVDRYRSEFCIVNVSGLPMGRFLTKVDQVHERQRYRRFVGKWQGRLDYLFVPWLNRNIPEWNELNTKDIHEIRIETVASYLFAGRRLIGTLNWFVKETDYEFIFLTTTSSFLNLGLLSKKIEQFNPSEYVYMGQLLGDKPKQFVSGAGQLLSRATAELVLRNFKKFPQEMLNDAALGSLLRELNIKPTDHPWLWLRSEKEVKDLRLEDVRDVFHFRTKTFEPQRNDATIMRSLHECLVKMNQEGDVYY